MSPTAPGPRLVAESVADSRGQCTALTLCSLAGGRAAGERRPGGPMLASRASACHGVVVSSASFSAGVIQPSVFRGRPLSSAATWSSSSWLTFTGLRLGKY